MKKFKKILFISLWSALIIGLLVSMGFVNKQQDSLLCKSLDIKVNQENDLYFLDKIDIAQLMRDRGDSIIGQPKATINVPEIERVLNSHEDIANAEVFMSIDGVVQVNVKQRKPVIRVINEDGDSYYLDEEGTLMPLSDKYTVNVLVANGAISEPFAARYKYSVTDISKDSLLNSTSMLGKLFAMANYINADEFWKSQVQQIYINSEKDMEIVPMVGNQKIIFGDTSAMDEKFKKLLTFYQQGLNTTGWWDKYSIINLKFKNQIVCTKKGIVNREEESGKKLVEKKIDKKDTEKKETEKVVEIKEVGKKEEGKKIVEKKKAEKKVVEKKEVEDKEKKIVNAVVLKQAVKK